MTSKTNTAKETPAERKDRIMNHYTGLAFALGSVVGIYVGRTFTGWIETFVLALVFGASAHYVAKLIVDAKVKL
ncbi:hypothetical protein JNJ66_06125 [Candidatus Saccharibacteria bacterium]|nr:hypothetical protein [Candidatus Saccharibacteria bacterium]